jgi:formylglycine-generating enzyme required for sulfatase activity
MPHDKQNSAAFGQALEKGDSDDFVMPVAPPPAPKGVATRANENNQPLIVEDIREDLTRSTKAATTTGETLPGETKNFQLTGSTNIQMCWIPPGKFTMGSHVKESRRNTDENLHLVEFSRGFWMAKYSLMQEQWFAVMGTRPSAFGKRGKLRSLIGGSGEQWKVLPVESVSWIDICGNNHRRGGFLGMVSPSAPRGWRFDLPSETQWEYACRAGTTTAFNNGGGLARFSLWSSNLSKLGWYAQNNGERIHPVGQKLPNSWGLYDMHGNVREWCSDHYGEYPKVAKIDPLGPLVGEGRVNRGGGWSSNLKSCRSACRSFDKEEHSSKRLGFRLILRDVS